MDIPIRAAIVIVSDKGFSGERPDGTGPVLKSLLAGRMDVLTVRILPDERSCIADTLKKLSDGGGIDLVLTSGGTGLSPRDVTPEATNDVIDRPVPGIPEAMRQKSLLITDRAMLSRAAAGIRRRTLIVNLPGSPKAAAECMEILLPVLPHAIETLRGDTSECARTQ